MVVHRLDARLLVKLLDLILWPISAGLWVVLQAYLRWQLCGLVIAVMGGISEEQE